MYGPRGCELLQFIQQALIRIQYALIIRGGSVPGTPANIKILGCLKPRIWGPETCGFCNPRIMRAGRYLFTDFQQQQQKACSVQGLCALRSQGVMALTPHSVRWRTWEGAHLQWGGARGMRGICLGVCKQTYVQAVSSAVVGKMWNQG